jgi:DNA-binding FadR family transcriptional regulator
MNNVIIKKSLASEIADKLSGQIAAGRYKVGEKLPTEPALMKYFGVGRSTIREATKNLLQRGLLRIQQGAGTFVEQTTGSSEPIEQRLKRAEARDLDEVRQLLEMKIAEKAAINRSQKDIMAIKGHLDARNRAARAGLIEACIDADILFHVSIADACKNEILADLYRATSVHLKNWFLQIYPDTQRFADTQDLHEQLLKNIVACDSKAAWNTVSLIIGRTE